MAKDCKHLNKNNDRYQNIIIVDKNIKGLLLRKGYGISELRKPILKEWKTIGNFVLVCKL